MFPALALPVAALPGLFIRGAWGLAVWITLTDAVG